jgi:hypothetical protein
MRKRLRSQESAAPSGKMTWSDRLWSILSRFWVSSVAVILTVALCQTACDRTNETRSSVLAQNRKWQVIAVGDLERSPKPFFTEVVRFRVVTDGRTYAEGRLYESDNSDDPFSREFTRSEWIGENALRFWYPPVSGTTPLVRLSVHNAGETRLEWLRIGTTELFLLLDLARGGRIDLPLFKRGDFIWFVIEGRLEGGPTIRSELETPQGTFREVQLTIKDGKASLRSQ